LKKEHKRTVLIAFLLALLRILSLAETHTVKSLVTLFFLLNTF